MLTEYEQLTKAIDELGERLRNLEQAILVQPILGINPVKTSVNLTLTAYHYVVLVDTTLGNVTITLPAAGFYGYDYYIKGTGGGNNIVIDGNGNSVDANPTETITTPYGVRHIKGDGIQWWLL